MRNDHHTVVAAVLTDPPGLERRIVRAMAAIALASALLGAACLHAWGASPPVVLTVGSLLLAWLPGLEMMRRQARQLGRH